VPVTGWVAGRERVSRPATRNDLTPRYVVLRDSESRNPVRAHVASIPPGPGRHRRGRSSRYPAPAACPLTPVTTGRTGRR